VTECNHFSEVEKMCVDAAVIVIYVDFVGGRLLWIDSRLATLNAYVLSTSSREVLHTFVEYQRHPAGLAVFEVTSIQLHCTTLYIDMVGSLLV